MATEREGAVWNAFRSWVRSRPRVIQALMADLPPTCVVKTRPGISLLIPAPGVEGTVQSYREDGTVGVVAPVTIPHPVHGWGRTHPGEQVLAYIHPAWLVFEREGAFARADVEAALTGEPA